MTETSQAKELYPVQYDYVFDEHRWSAFVGGRNSGKTYAGSWKAIMSAQRGGLGIIAAPDFPMLEFGAKRAFLQRLEDIRVPYMINGQRAVVTIPRWSAEVRFATLENESRVRGPNYAWGWVDEVEYVTSRPIWNALKGAVRDGTSPQLFVTTTPKGRRLVYDEWVVNGSDDHALFRSSTRDNPYIDAERYIRGLGYTGRYYEQEIEAGFVGFEGLVYPQFTRETHIAERDCDGWRTTLAVDVGTRNPTAILTLRWASDGRLHVEREVYRRGMSSDEIVDAVGEECDRCRAEVVYLDPSASDYILTLVRRGYPAVKANNDVRYGIGLVTTALADGLTVDPSCVNLISEFESYRYPDNREQDDRPVKESDHAMDALRYGIASEATAVSGPLMV